MSLEFKVKFSKARGAVGYLIPVVFQQKLDIFESSPVGHTLQREVLYPRCIVSLLPVPVFHQH